ncbi:something about silencing, SAS, complex subunit 4-domain-containing protein [Pyrenochaeta sp. MPI-SDFR-AT-0127]|nr:something about silencing, SAS, complex subunit 4-domain-containing protein [Pyrenochaeta sp. MPI-SDFR-AT-0127]
MAHVVRPPLRASTERRSRLTLSPVAPDDAHRNNTAVTTRRTSRTGPLLALAADDKPVQQLSFTPAKQQAPPTRIANSRKRSATALTPDATDTRPPTKITVTQPHGELLRITNGVATPLGIDADDVRSGTSTPRPGSSGKLTVPAPGSSTSQDKRSLRSHDGGSRLKSDLATYFSNYDDIIAGAPKPAELLDLDTPIYLVDEPTKSKTPTPATPEPSRTSISPSRSRKPKGSPPPRKASVASLPPAQSSTTFQVLDYAAIAKHIRYNDGEDPLADSVYFTQHRRAERKEKQLRNIEKERAMHEKVQLERLLDGLQGPDWLKVMGITGVTDGERKDWEPKRNYFVKEVEALVDKFRMWKVEEKRLRTEKEAALAAREEDDEDEESEESDTVRANGRDLPPPRHHPKTPEPPKPRRPPRPHGFLLPFIPPEPAVPFQSFYAKPHLRAAALGKHRHGRNASAFGLPIPEFGEMEFEPPEDYVDPQFLRDNARQRRRRKRESGVTAQPGLQ